MVGWNVGKYVLEYLDGDCPARERVNPYARIITAPPAKKIDGEKVCCWCWRPISGARRKWCGQNCVTEYTLRADPSAARWHVLKRDGWACSECSIDLQRLPKGIGPAHLVPCQFSGTRENLPRMAWSLYPAMLAGMGLSDRTIQPECDHIVPVSEGGGNLGLKNLRILCPWCHSEETAELSRRAAKKRRAKPGQQELALAI